MASNTKANPTTDSNDPTGGDIQLAPPTTTADDLDHDTPYLGRVNNTKPYGVFVRLTPSIGTDLIGLAHKSNLPLLHTPGEYEPGELVVVRLHELRDDGPSFNLVGTADEFDPIELPDGDPTAERRARDYLGDDSDTTAEEPDTESGREADDEPDAAEIEELQARLDALEAELSSDDEPRGEELDADLSDLAGQLLGHYNAGSTVETVRRAVDEDGGVRYTVEINTNHDK